MASPMLEGRSLNPREKAQFSLHISDRVTQNDGLLGEFSSIKYNHKPTQLSSDRKATLASTSADRYTLKIQDREDKKNTDIFTFTGQKTIPKKSYVLLFDATSQKATLEPLDSTYTFNLSTQNQRDVSSKYTKIYPKKQKDDTIQEAGAAADDLFDEGGKAALDDIDGEPDPNNPYDFRHFLKKEGQDKRGDESEYNIPSSPDYRTGTGSAMNTPLVGARKPAATTTTTTSKPSSSQAASKPRKRKSPEPSNPMVSRKTGTKKAQPTPTVRIDRRASARPAPTDSKSTKKTASTAPASKIKSAAIVHSSDESDIDAEGEVVPSPPSVQQSTEPTHTHHYVDDESDEDEYAGGGAGGLVIENPDERSAKPRNNALASLGLGQSLGLGGLSRLRSPSNGPVSLASMSAANSVEGSPNPAFDPRKQKDVDVIDFGDLGGGSDEEGYEEDAEGEEEEVEDRDVEPMDIGPPAQTQQGTGAAAAAARKMSVGGQAMEEDEDDILAREMMEGLAGGDSSEESEEE